MISQIQKPEARAATTSPIRPIQKPHLALPAYSLCGLSSSFLIASRETKIATSEPMKLSGPLIPAVFSRMPSEISAVKNPTRACFLPGGSGAGAHCP